jgi:spermidine dehydrogenase
MSSETGRGMHRRGRRAAWSRRDFIQGVAAATVVGSGLGSSASASPSDAPYPPGLMGLRGAHPGSFEPAHALAMGGRAGWGPVSWPDDEVYDLVVVGGGLSGLAAAWFFRQERPEARVLIVDNHDDFGGHAKRNEFQVDGRTLIGYGGGQSFDSPQDYSRWSRRLLRDVGVDLERFETAYDAGFFKRHGLSAGVYFDRDTYGVDRLLRCDLMRYLKATLPLAPAGVSLEQAIPQMPLSEGARRAFLDLVRLREDRMPGGLIRNALQLGEMSYQAYLEDVLGVQAPEIIRFWSAAASEDYAYGIDKIPALDALIYGLPGMHGSSLRHIDGIVDRAIDRAPPYIHHFPSGLAGLARLLVARMVPAVGAQGDDQEALVTRRLDYAKLDVPGSPVRIRLSTFAMHVEQQGQTVAVTTLRQGRASGVRAKACILAGNNRLIPHICPSLPAEQRAALGQVYRLPLVNTNVALRNWRAWEAAGVGWVHSPGSFHSSAELDFPVSIGKHRYTEGPDHPVIVRLVRVPRAPGLPLRAQAQAGRAELLSTPFETFESEVLTHLDGMLSPHGFDCERDIAGITVNRWPHGYAHDHASLDDPSYARGEAPHERGRVPFGRISIANSDSGGRAYADSAIDQGHRAVCEVLSKT